MDIPSVEKLLTTTRSVRKRLDLSRPVPQDILEHCLELAIQAPTGSNAQGWRFMVVTDPEKRGVIGEYYGRSFKLYAEDTAKNAPKYSGDDPRNQRCHNPCAGARRPAPAGCWRNWPRPPWCW